MVKSQSAVLVGLLFSCASRFYSFLFLGFAIKLIGYILTGIK